jgi:Flp pilus assembly protein TadD
VCLAVILFSVGCNIRQFFGGAPSEQLPDKFWAGVRPASGETERLLRNFRYLKAAGRTHLALKELEEAHQRDPNNCKITDILAQCYEELGVWDRAEKLYVEALAHDPDNPALANNLCFSYYLAGKFDKAESCFRELLKRQPHNATLRNNLGLLLARTGRQDEAYRLWREGEGEAMARERLNQALAALGLAPQPNVARRPELDKAKRVDAAASPRASASAPPEIHTAPPPPPPQEMAARPAPPEKPEKPVPSKSGSVTHLARPLAHLASKNQVTDNRTAALTASMKPAAEAAKPAVSPRTPPPAAPAPSPVKTRVKVAAQAAPKQAPKVPSAPAAPVEPKRQEFLTAQVLLRTRIDIKNGNGVKGMADLNRTWLTMEGFTVVAIGNHIDFGLGKTVIQYQPSAERVARTLKEDFFQQADLKPNGKLGQKADVRIILGHDQKSRKSQIAERIALLDLRAQLAVILASSGKNVPSPPVAPAPQRAEAQAAQTPQAAPAAAAVSEPGKAKALHLTAAELTNTKIELRNGNGVQDQARRLRSALALQGFNVVRIKNHIDFGMQQTVIFYRPGSGKMARALGQKFFQTARMEEAAKLPKNVDVKVILGRDLAGSLDLLAKLSH